MTSNSVSGGKVEHASRKEDMKAYDGLPAWLRRRVSVSVTNMSSVFLAREVEACRRKKMTEDEIERKALAALDRSEILEIAEFAKRWPKKMGGYPFLAAGGTVQGNQGRRAVR